VSLFSLIPAGVQAVLEGMPRELRPALLELVAVSYGAKPVVRVTARTHQVSTLTNWLAQRNFRFLLRRQEIDSSTFAQIAPAHRHILDNVLWQIFVARHENALSAVAAALQSPTSYVDIGCALGYPICCVNWAAQSDKIDHSGSAVRQTNLVAEAMKRTQSFAAECNCLLRDCAFAEFPATVISHYPCRFDCAESVAQAKVYMACLDKQVPGASTYLRRLLTKPHLWWSDAQWPVTFANEVPGMMLDIRDQESAEGAHFVSLSGPCATPGGDIPENGTVQEIGMTRLLLRSGSELHSIDLIASGSPHLLRWS
jgi:hypothetical protein